MSDDQTVDQAPEQSAELSISDKIAAKFGLPGEASQETGANTEVQTADDWDSALAELKGQYDSPKALKESLMRNEDYTRKTQELATQRRSYEQAAELARNSQLERAFETSVAQERKDLDVIDAYLAQTKAMDWASMSTEQMLRARMEIESVKERRQAVEQSIAAKKSQFDNEISSRIKDLRGKARETASKLPGWSEDADKSMREYALSVGLTESELDNVLMDTRSYKVLMDAAQFAKVQQSAGKATQAVQKVVKPGASSDPMPKETAAKLNLRKAQKNAQTSGEKARNIEQFLAGRFG